MAFNADIVVTESGSSHVLLIVEAKTNGSSSQFEHSLKRYMWEMICPTGLFVSPRSIVVYRNFFTDYTDDSVKKLGEFASPHSWLVFENPGLESEFETRVQSWLEQLGNDANGPDMPEETSKALSEYVMPSLKSGEIHAAGPRATT